MHRKYERAGQMGISFSGSWDPWLNAASERSLPSLARKPRSLLPWVLMISAIRLPASLPHPAVYGLDLLRCRSQRFEPLLGHADIATTTIYTRGSADDLAPMMAVSESPEEQTVPHLSTLRLQGFFLNAGPGNQTTRTRAATRSATPGDPSFPCASHITGAFRSARFIATNSSALRASPSCGA
jgi:hypothetical protein